MQRMIILDKICKHVLRHDHVKGRCLMHSGKQRRRGSAITSGKQCDLIQLLGVNRKKPRQKEAERIIFNVQVTLRNHDEDNSDIVTRAGVMARKMTNKNVEI